MEQAVQYCVAAARATFDKDKKDSLETLLLQGNVVLDSSYVSNFLFRDEQILPMFNSLMFQLN